MPPSLPWHLTTQMLVKMGLKFAAVLHTDYAFMLFNHSEFCGGDDVRELRFIA